MYDSAANGHSYSTPSSPSPYTSQPAGSDSKPTYDKELASLFRATAANVTQLYKEASEIGQTAYKSGYEQCYNDILEVALAAAHMPGNEGQPLTLQQLLEFARQKRIAPKTAFQHAATSRMMQSNSSQGTRLVGGKQGIPRLQLLPQCNLDSETLVTPTSPHAVGDPALLPPETCTFDNPAVTMAAVPEQLAADVSGISSCPEYGRQRTNELKRRSSIQARRNKRQLDAFESMDIEPPRRRQRREDVEMS